jgi:uncharacterized small protein (DUF1192 family)
MKKTLLAAVAIAGFAFTTGAQAQSTIESGSSLLYFNKMVETPETGTTNISNSLVVNLGDLSSTSFSSFNLSLNTALVAAYGAGWSTDDTIKWAVIGGFDGAAASPNTYGVVYSKTSSNNLSMLSVYELNPKIDVLFAEANAEIYTASSVLSNLGNSHKTVLIENGSMNADGVVSNGFGTYALDQDGFATWNGGLATFQYVTNSQSIYFNKLMNEGGVYGSQPSVKTGTITLASDGTLSVNSVPEPSTYALFGFAALLLIVAYRRANA